MPQDVTCPKCKHLFPVTEARQAFTVSCPQCDSEMTAEFKKRTGPVPAGEPAYELFVRKGALPTAPPPVPKKRDEEDDEPKSRGGGSALVVLLSGGLGLLVVMGGLALTGWYLFTQVDVETASKRSNQSGNPRSNVGGNPNPNPSPGPNPRPPTPQPQPKPKPKNERFELRPVAGPVPRITPPTLAEESSVINLRGKVGAVAVGGGGRYLVMHIPERAELMVFDASTAQTLVGASDAGTVLLAAGLDRVAVLGAANANVLRVYALPGLTKLFEEKFPADGIRSIAMGSRTNGPLLAIGRGGDPVLVEVSGNGLNEIEAARKPNLGLHWNMLRAAPDGKAFATFDGFDPRRNNSVKLLTESGRAWKVTSLLQVPFPGADGNFYGNGAVFDRSGNVQSFGGVGLGSGHWYVPAVSSGDYFLKASPITVGTGARAKKTLAVTVHNNRDANTPARGTEAFSDLPDFDGLMDRFRPEPDVPLDQHLFLIPEAKLLVILGGSKDKLYLRKVPI
jgi:hypothetical protein